MDGPGRFPAEYFLSFAIVVKADRNVRQRISARPYLMGTDVTPTAKTA